ncbi:hypothetical protein Tco_1019959 [Tanacetum coccineum]|uniref:Uncharacterized protein n=1 Tax=Tanacetum coccineum TaxID=301880 RepID=A0ABQ5G0C4_9ASTR
MSTLAEYRIVVSAENHPPMLDKSMYNSWESRMFPYIKGKKNSRMMLESIDKGPTPCHILISPKPCVHIRIESIDLENNCTRRINDCVVMLLLVAFRIPSCVSFNVEFLTIKPPMIDTIRGTYVIGADIKDPHFLSVKEEGKEEEGTKKRKGGHIKMIARKKKRSQSDVDSDDEHKKCLKIVTFESILDSEIMEKKSVIARLNKVSSPDGDYLVIYRANGNFRAFNYLMEVLHIFDRQDLFHLYDLMREQYSEVTLDGFALILWGDLKIMMESSTEGNEQSDFWSGQQDWKIVTWRLYESCGVCILEFEDGIVIHMLVERRYPLSKDLLQRMLDLGLEVERESSVALDLIRFIKQQIDEE